MDMNIEVYVGIEMEFSCHVRNNQQWNSGGGAMKQAQILQLDKPSFESWHSHILVTRP